MKHLMLGLMLLASAPIAAAQSAEPSSLPPPRDYQEDFFVTPYWTRTPVIEAIGRAEMEVAPNRANFSVTYLETDRTANDAMKTAVERARLAYDTIKKVAGDKARVQSSVSVQPYFEQYRDGDGNVIENQRADKVKGYEARSTLTVTVEGDTALAGKARAGALALGPENSTPLNAYLQTTAEMTRAAYEAAVADGAARAKASAAASGTTLGKLMVVQEGNGPCLGRWSTGPGRVSGGEYYPAPPPMAAMAAPMARDMAVAEQMIQGKQVTITQGDIDALNLPNDDLKQTVSANVCMIYAVGN